MLAAARRILARLAPAAVLCLWAIAGLAELPARKPAYGHGAAAAETFPAVDGKATPTPEVPLSPLEAAFSARAESRLTLFGYDNFQQATTAPPAPTPMGAVQDDYMLGIGDELTIITRADKPFQGRFVIGNQGQLLLPEMAPIAAAGRSLGELRQQLKQALGEKLVVAEVYAYLTDVRRVGIVVLGAVAKPGRHELSAFATPLDAILTAGGVRRDGSLRGIRLFRAGEAAEGIRIDLYQLLLPDGNPDAVTRRLKDGDRVLVPPLGPTLAIAGPVKRPGIFELPDTASRLTLGQLLELAGGPLRPARQAATRLSIGVDGRESATAITDEGLPTLGDGDLVLYRSRNEDRQGIVHIDGAVLRPGPRTLPPSRRLRDLVSSRDLQPGAYRDFAVLTRPSPAGGSSSLTAVDLSGVLAGRSDIDLQGGERLAVLGAEDIDFLTSEAVLALLRGNDNRENNNTAAASPPRCAGLGVLARALAADPGGPLANGPQARIAVTLAGSSAPCPPLFDSQPDLLAFAISHAALIRNGVPRPGFYPVAVTTALGRLDRAAGGSGRSDGDGSQARIGSGDIVDLAGPRVELIGQVKTPGVRPLARTPSLAALLSQGRGLDAGAYPLAGVIERFSGTDRNRRLLAFSPSAIAAGQGNQPLKDRDRVHVFSTPRIKAMLGPPARAAKDSEQPEIMDGHMVEPPDATIVAFLAERTVQVRGAVLQPGSLPVAGPTAVAALIDAAGGLTPQADEAAIEVTIPERFPPRRMVSLSQATAEGLSVPVGGAIRVNPRPAMVEAGSVLVEGEVRRPGHYDIVRGEKLSSLLARAGGLTEEAYPAGIVFLRESAKHREKSALEEQARSLERTVTLLLQKGDPVRQEDVGLARQLAAQLRGLDPPGRIVVEADPVILLRWPEKDTLLESGDRISIPKRPLTVAVTGEVLSPGSFPFEPGKDAGDYLRDAGGPTGLADTDRVYVLLPGGRAEPQAISFWNHRSSMIPPGATVVVPTDPRPFSGRELAQTLASIVGQLAVTAASISVISR